MTSPNPMTGSVRLYGWQNGLILGLLVSSIVSIFSSTFLLSLVLAGIALFGSLYWHFIPTIQFFFD